MLYCRHLVATVRTKNPERKEEEGKITSRLPWLSRTLTPLVREYKHAGVVCLTWQRNSGSFTPRLEKHLEIGNPWSWCHRIHDISLIKHCQCAQGQSKGYDGVQNTESVE
ncbi:hypothetical protein E2C01_017401 [Portunus trituberculatus]|uniref:Uncharacterized protein n=1 Tax=Portunus trituberculatus TaxID=210409 RepID=A0A5B7DTD0_PORTR|nr:hypothetical protein [Portunus trituberculatus]